MKQVVLLCMFLIGLFGLSQKTEAQENDNRIHLITGSKIGYNLYNNVSLYNNYTHRQTYLDFSNTLFIEVKTGFRWKNITVMGTYENTFKQKELDRYNPVQDRYMIDIYYTFGNFIFNFNHWCSHPVVTNNTYQMYNNDSARRSFSIEYIKEW